MLMMLKLEELMLVVVIAVLPWQISFLGHGLGVAEAPWEGLVDEDGRSDLLAQLSFHVPCKNPKIELTLWRNHPPINYSSGLR